VSATESARQFGKMFDTVAAVYNAHRSSLIVERQRHVESTSAGW
jgi:hypothetical protein